MTKLPEGWTAKDVAAAARRDDIYAAIALIEAYAQKRAERLLAGARQVTAFDIDRYDGEDEVGECHFCGARNFYPKTHTAACPFSELRAAIADFQKGEQ